MKYIVSSSNVVSVMSSKILAGSTATGRGNSGTDVPSNSAACYLSRIFIGNPLSSSHGVSRIIVLDGVEPQPSSISTQENNIFPVISSYIAVGHCGLQAPLSGSQRSTSSWIYSRASSFSSRSS